MLKAEKISKRFLHPSQVEVLRDINLEVEEGQTVAITGASGEGKSTLLHILGKLEPPSSGTVTIAGESSNVSKLRNQALGFVFQSFYLFNDYSVIDNVLMPARIARQATHRGSKAYGHAEQLLSRVGLGHRRDFLAKLLSGGEKQRVAIARALCNDPPLILADEPSGNLDHRTSQSIHDLLLNVVSEEGKTLVVVTHDQTLAKCCDRVYTLQGGILV